MAYNRKIKVNELDFLTIRENLKNYLSGLDEFTDFNFEGSGISIMLDLLAYVTHYQGFYNNMIANEMFLDSAIKRTSVVSHAKLMGYTPSSASSSTMTVDITISDADESTTVLTKHSNFTAVKDGTRYNFTNEDAETFEVLVADSTKIVRGVVLREGSWRSASFIVDSNADSQRFIIPEANVDTSTLEIRVQKSTTDSDGYADVWTKVSDITQLTSTSKVYYLQEIENGTYEIYFGDGILGTKLDDDNIITIDYLVTNGRAANNIGFQDSTSSKSVTSGNSSIIDITVVSPSSGGGGKESLTSIKYNAPKTFQSQNRSVTINDYKTFISQNYGTANDVFVWGGENNDPPEYGKVFISVKPTGGSVLSQEEKLSLQNLLKTQNIVSIVPEVVDPNYIYLKIKTDVSYNPDETTKTLKDIGILVNSQIMAYSVVELEKFDRNFRHSKFVKNLDDSDTSVLGNDTSIIMQKRIEPVVGEARTYTIKFENSLYHPHDGHMSIINTSAFSYIKSDGTFTTALIDDDGYGTLRIYEVINGVKNIINSNTGNVDYTKGILSLKDFMPSGVQGTILKIDAVPTNKDILSERNGILQIDSSDSESVTVNVVAYKPYNMTSSSISSTVFSSDTSGSGGGY
jgi:hypothetical protein